MKGTLGSRLTAILGVFTFAAVTGLVGIGVALDLDAKAPPVPVQSAQPRTLRVATWNVRDCAATDSGTGERLSFHDSIAGTIAAQRIDVIVFQEIQADSGTGGDIALLSVALAKAGWSMPYTAVVDAKGSDDLAVFSRRKITEHGPILTPSGPSLWPRPGIAARIELDGASLDVYGFHFKAMADQASQKARKDQAEAVAAYLKETYGPGLPGAMVVLAGDFNTTEEEELEGKGSTLSILALREDQEAQNDFFPANLSVLGNAPTFVDSRYSSVLDHILLSPGLGAGMGKGMVRLVEGGPGKGAIPVSDHRMVVAEIALLP